MLEVLAPRLMIEKTIPRPQAAARALKHPSQCPALLARDGSPLAGPLTCRMRSGRSSFSWQRPPIGKWGRPLSDWESPTSPCGTAAPSCRRVSPSVPGRSRCPVHAQSAAPVRSLWRTASDRIEPSPGRRTSVILSSRSTVAASPSRSVWVRSSPICARFRRLGARPKPSAAVDRLLLGEERVRRHLAKYTGALVESALAFGDCLLQLVRLRWTLVGDLVSAIAHAIAFFWQRYPAHRRFGRGHPRSSPPMDPVAMVRRPPRSGPFVRWSSRAGA